MKIVKQFGRNVVVPENAVEAASVAGTIKYFALRLTGLDLKTCGHSHDTPVFHFQHEDQKFDLALALMGCENDVVLFMAIPAIEEVAA